MSKIILSSIAVAALSFAVPALDSGPDGAAAANGTVRDTSQVQPNPRQRVCVVYNITGSLLPQKTCKTRKEWAAEGIDPFAK